MSLTDRWLDLIRRNDGAGAIDFLRTNKAEDWQQQMALQHDPIPGKVLGALDKLGRLEENWLHNNMRLDSQNAINWAAVLACREAEAGRNVVIQDIQNSFQAVINEYSTLTSIRSSETSIQGRCNLLLAMLDKNPTLVKDDYDRGFGVNHTLVVLSTQPASSDWLARSGVEITPLLRAAAKGSALMTLSGSGGQALAQWLAKHDKFQEAWDEIAIQDFRLSQQQADWFEQWLPHGQWRNSPLEAWCGDILTGWKQGQEGDGPLDHPALIPPWPMLENGDTDVKKVAENYQKSLNSTQRQKSLYLHAARVNNALRDSMSKAVGADDWGVLDCPLEPLGMGLYYQQPWAMEAMKDDQDSRRIQNLMAQDRRVLAAGADFPLKQVGEWILEQPSWRTWKDPRGHSLLEVCLNREVANNLKAFLPKAMLLKLAKVAPDLLMKTNDEGVRVLDSLEVPDASKAAVRRALLQQETKNVARRSKGKSRNM